MTGTANQIEWAEQIRVRVGAEFDRVANALESTTGKQTGQKRMDTQAVIAILKIRRADVMARDEAGHFIQEWQELRDQVRQMTAKDFRYQAIKANGGRDTSPYSHKRKLNWRLTAMKIRPLYDRIVVKRIEEQETLRSGIIIPDSAKEKPQEGEVVAVGQGKRLEDGTLVALDVKIGDRILFGKYSGNEIRLDGNEYMIMREDDILGVLDAAPKAAKKAS